MKLKDILKTDTDNKGWLRVFKKLGADNETMKFVNDNVGKESSGGGSSRIKYYRFKNVGDETILQEIERLLWFCSMFKYKNENKIAILTFVGSDSLGNDYFIYLTHVQFSPMYVDEIMVNDFDDIDKMNGTNYSQYFELTTEEEFYKID